MSLRRNILANYLGQGWTALMGLAFLPLYIKYLGMEAYGLIGVYAVMQAWMALADMGMTPTLNREMARLTAGGHTPQSIGDLVRSLEVLCIGVAIAIALAVWFAASWLAEDWLRAERLARADIVQAIAVMGLVASLRLVEGLYRGAMLGLQRQVWINAVGAALATLRWAGAVAVLAWISPSIEAFFLWQGIVSLGTLIVFAAAVHRALPATPLPTRFSRPALAGITRFASGMLVTTVLALLLTQVDKMLLSRLLSLEAFGVYTLAGTVAGALYQLVVPITQAFYPRFTELVTSGDSPGLVLAYHRGAQLVCVLLVPVALIMIFFGEDLLALWTANPTLAHDTAPLLALLALGTLLNGLLHIPYMLQLAHGWSGFGARVNTVAVIVLIPSILWVVPRYGPIGAASVWVVLNAGYVLFSIHFMHVRLLPHEKWRWYRRDVLLPGVSATTMALACMLAHPGHLSRMAESAWLFASGILTLAAALAAAPALRDDAIRITLERMHGPCVKP